MTSVIKAHEVKLGHKYRLFPNRFRTRYLEVTPVVISRHKVIFVHFDPDTKTTKQINDVDLLENVIRVA